MKLRDLEYLVAVYELKNFSNAADQCFVSQPTLSGQLKKLEEELGVSLMERSTRSVLFTNAGEKVVAEAKKMLEISKQIKEVAREHDDPLAGDFHLGLIPTVGPFLLPKIMNLLSNEFPRMRLFLHELKTDQLIERLLAGKLDAAILAKLDWDHPIAERKLYHEPLWLAVGNEDAMASAKSPLSESALKGCSLLMLEDGHCLRNQALGVCFAAGADEDNRYQATSMDTLLHMVASGFGMTLVPELATKNSIEGVTYLPFRKSGPGRDVIFINRKSSARTRALEQMARVISEKVSSFEN